MEVKESLSEAAIKSPVAVTAAPSRITVARSAAGPAGKQRSRARTTTNGTAAGSAPATAMPAPAAPALGSGSLPERWLVDGLGLVKGQARRRDLVGQAAYRYLQVMHGGVEMAMRALTRIERASQPPSRGVGRPTPPATRRSAPARRVTRRATSRLRRAG